MNRLQMPDWGRPGEMWRVEPETAVWWTTDFERCHCDPCWRRREQRAAVAAFEKRNGGFVGYCADHLRSGCMWIEGGTVVSWRLSAIGRPLSRDKPTPTGPPTDVR